MTAPDHFSRRTWAVLSLVILLVPLLSGPVASGQSQSPPSSLSLRDQTTVSPTEPVVVRLYVKDKEHLDAVAGELDIWETHPKEKYVVAAVTPSQYTWLESLGYQLEIDTGKTDVLGIQAVLDPRFYYFDDYYSNTNGLYVVDFLQDVNDNYPTLTELMDIGDAWEASQGGYHRDLWVLRITNEDPAYGGVADKPVFFLFATIHAREVTVPELAIRYVKYLHR